MTKSTIRSAAFPGVYLRLDGSGLTAPSEPGGGTVNCQYGAGPYETLEIESHPDGTVTIGSAEFKGVFLRLDGRGVPQAGGDGGGVVNCQVGFGGWEKFRLVPQPDGTTAIASNAFPNVYLRLDGRGLTAPREKGGGTVNAQGSVGPWEKFHIGAATPGLTAEELRRAIETYGPVVRFHPQERYLMCSVEAFLRHATLHDGRTKSTIVHPSPDQLPAGNQGDRRYWLTLEEGFKGGDLGTARAYVHAYWKPGMSYTDLQFWLFYAYNGPGTAHINTLAFDTIVHGGNADVSPLGEHFGDWESCMIRIDNATKRPIGVYLSQHSSGQMFGANELGRFTRVNGQQFVVYSSRNGHAVYPGRGSNYTEHRKYPDPGIPVGIEFFLRNDTDDGGHSLDCARHYQIVAAEWLGDAFPQPHWLDYQYRWGPEGTSSHLTANAVANILKAAIGDLGDFPETLLSVIASSVLASIVKDDFNGPSGPKTKTAWNGQY